MKLKLYNTCILPIFLYGSDCGVTSKTDARKIDALVSAYASWHQIVPICMEWWCTEANEATQTQCYNPVAPAYPIWAYYAHGQQCRCQEDPVSLRSGKLEKTTRSSPHHVAQHCPTGSETTPPYTPRSSRFGSKPPSVEDNVDVWWYALVSCKPETTTTMQLNALFCCLWRKVDTSCHKHFVVFSGNQHHRLLPATCRNLRNRGHGPPATLLTTQMPEPWSVAVLTAGQI